MKKRTRHYFIWMLVGGTVLAAALIARAAETNQVKPSGVETSRIFSHPDRIRYDGQCLTLDGRDIFIYSGSFHYFRCPKALWPERFAQIKTAGFNCVDTYIPWNLHERLAPKDPDDFSQVDLREFEDWLNLAEQAGLYVIARPGPYICSEFDRGGFPGWLITKRPAGWNEWSWFRSNDPGYLTWVRHWYDALFPLLARHQVTRKAPGQTGVILVFLENEYDHFAMDPVQRVAAVKTLATEALAQGIDVPLATCETDGVSGNPDPVLHHVFNVRNTYPGWKVKNLAGDLNKLRQRQPDAPLMLGEAQGGWFDFTWQTPSLHPNEDGYRENMSPAQINNLTLFALQNGVTLLNFYMLFGGSNLGDVAGRDIAATYDFNAPIRECGGVGEKYQRVAAIGQMLKEHGARLARSRIIDCQVTTSQPDVTAVLRQCPDGDRYIFVRTDQHTEARQGTARIQPPDGGREITLAYQLDPFGSKIFFLPGLAAETSAGQWLPQPFPAAPRPDHLPAPVTIHQVSRRPKAEPTEWKTLPPGVSLNDVGIYDNRFVFYRASFNLDTRDLAQAAGWRLRISYPTLTTGTGGTNDQSLRDHVWVRINGRDAGEADALAGDVSLPAPDLRAGQNQITLLYQNAGCLKESNWMEKEAGVRHLRLLPAAPADEILQGWKMLPVTNLMPAETLPEITPDFDDHDGKTVRLENIEAGQLSHGKTVVFRTHFNLTATDIKNGRTGLFVSQMADYGWVFVNGKKIGQTDSKIIAHTFDLAGTVQPGSNVVAIVVSAVDLNAPGGLGLVAVTWPETAGILPDRPLEYAGLAEEITDPKPGGSRAEMDWEIQPLPAPPVAANALLTWHQLSFQLPAAARGVWVPWLARLHASGDGFIYLNNHELGRFWGAGAQHDYYLPECWLNPGERNILTLCLSPGKNGASVQSAEIIPYYVYAEKR